MIYVDEITYHPNSSSFKRYCRLATDSTNLEELHKFASKLGLQRAWFQDTPHEPHYKLVTTKRALAIQLGARAVTTLRLFETCYPELVKAWDRAADQIFS